jgi:hypothetical protein
MGNQQVGASATRRGALAAAAQALAWPTGAGKHAAARRPKPRRAVRCGESCTAGCAPEEASDRLLAQVFEISRAGRLKRIEIGLVTTSEPFDEYFVQVVEASVSTSPALPEPGRAAVLATAFATGPEGATEGTPYTLAVAFPGPGLSANTPYAVILGRTEAGPIRFQPGTTGACDRHLQTSTTEQDGPFVLGQIDAPLALAVFVT